MERKLAEEKINASLKEKELLLREIHHRVKNNIQVISSLLKLQYDYIKDKEAQEMLIESQNRIEAMALIHEKLYQTENLSRIDFKRYIETLTDTLFDFYGVCAERILLKIDVDKVLFGIDAAIPCGLIVNELVSNSLKHAFPEGRCGEIKIALLPLDENVFELTVSDNGMGLPRGLDFRNTESLGLQLVNILTEQLHGEIEIDRASGTEFKITFKRKKHVKRKNSDSRR